MSQDGRTSGEDAIAWYRIDAARAGLLDGYRIARTIPAFLELLAARRAGTPFPAGRPVRDAPAERLEAARLPPRVLADLAPVVADMTALGLQPVAALRESAFADEAYALVLRTPDGTVAGRVRWQAVVIGDVEHVAVSHAFLSRDASGNAALTTSAPPGRPATAGLDVAHVPPGPMGAVLERHRRWTAAHAVALPDPAQAFEDVQRRDFAELRSRGLLVPMTDAHRARVQQQERAARTAPGPIRVDPARHPVTVALLVTCCGIWALNHVTAALFQLLAPPPLGILTSCLVHVELLHLAFNMGWLWQLGPAAEEWLGRLRFLAFVALTAVVSALAQILAGSGWGIGFSGVVYALVGYLWMVRRRAPSMHQALPDSTIHLALVWLPIGVVLSATGALNIGNAAHAGGLAIGLLLGKPWARRAGDGDDASV